MNNYNLDFQVYADLAWKGLTNGEVSALNALPQADKERIVRRIMAEQYGTSDEKQIQRNLAKIWIVSLLLLAVTSCKSYKDSTHWEDVERYNGSSITQRGSVWIKTGESASISGTIKYFGSNQPLEEARVTFLSQKGDTVLNVISDKKGKFTGIISPFGFSGSVVVYKVYERFQQKILNTPNV